MGAPAGLLGLTPPPFASLSAASNARVTNTVIDCPRCSASASNRARKSTVVRISNRSVFAFGMPGNVRTRSDGTGCARET